MSIKVLQFINAFSTGGAEQMAKRLALGFDPQRVRSDVWSLWRGQHPEVEEAFGAALQAAGLRHGCLAKPLGVPDPRTVVRLATLLRRHEYQVLHLHCDSPAFYGRLAAWFTPKVRTLVTVHSHIPPAVARLERGFQRITDRYVACSDETLEDLRQRCRVPGSKVTRILNGIDGDRTARVRIPRETIRARHGVALSVPVALVLGRISQQKAQLDVVEALARRDPRLAELRVWMVGDDRVEPEYAARVRARVVEAGLADRITLFGVVTDDRLDEMLKGTDIFLLPSEREGLSVAILESLGAGIPTVISDLATNRQATRDGDVAWLVPPHDPAALAATLASVLADPAGRQARAREGARWVLEAFGLDRVVQEYTEAYERLVGGRSGPESRSPIVP